MWVKLSIIYICTPLFQNIPVHLKKNLPPLCLVILIVSIAQLVKLTIKVYLNGELQFIGGTVEAVQKSDSILLIWISLSKWWNCDHNLKFQLISPPFIHKVMGK